MNPILRFWESKQKSISLLSMSHVAIVFTISDVMFKLIIERRIIETKRASLQFQKEVGGLLCIDKIAAVLLYTNKEEDG